MSVSISSLTKTHHSSYDLDRRCLPAIGHHLHGYPHAAGADRTADPGRGSVGRPSTPAGRAHAGREERKIDGGMTVQKNAPLCRYCATFRNTQQKELKAIRIRQYIGPVKTI